MLGECIVFKSQLYFIFVLQNELGWRVIKRELVLRGLGGEFCN